MNPIVIRPVRDAGSRLKPMRAALISIAAAVLSALLWPAAWAGGYARVTGPCGLVFPQDHGPHPDYKTEWWYYTGNLRAEDGRHLGFQLTFFRSRVVPPGGGKNPSLPASGWRAENIILGHAAVSDVPGRRFHHDSEAARDVLGMAHAGTASDRTAVALKKWSLEITPDAHRLSADARGFGIDLTLRPEKPPVLHGDQGYSRKGSTPERASCYYSFTRLGAEGVITVEGASFPVRGQAWMDHEFSTSPLEPGLVGWDWFSLQLSDGTEVMIYLLRTPDGSFHPASSGTFVEGDGRSRHLDRGDLRVTAESVWRSPHSRAEYPSTWRIEIVPLGLLLDVRANLPDQEMAEGGAAGVVYWEGSVSFSGVRAGAPVAGEGYVELTGYAEPLDVLK
ncbi:lipocalin-like domain-containing protein [Desulfococcus sp.]|uniref:lipocalin-like domain-containing protein n=1 Tax=Desulfococcus sp. TaxID=2025834 RepID=UPI003594234B